MQQEWQMGIDRVERSRELLYKARHLRELSFERLMRSREVLEGAAMLKQGAAARPQASLAVKDEVCR